MEIRADKPLLNWWWWWKFWKEICEVYLNINITGGHKVWGAPTSYH